MIDATTFNSIVCKENYSLKFYIPKPSMDYLGAMAGDEITIKILKMNNQRKYVTPFDTTIKLEHTSLKGYIPNDIVDTLGLMAGDRISIKITKIKNQRVKQ